MSIKDLTINFSPYILLYLYLYTFMISACTETVPMALSNDHAIESSQNQNQDMRLLSWLDQKLAMIDQKSTDPLKDQSIPIENQKNDQANLSLDQSTPNPDQSLSNPDQSTPNPDQMIPQICDCFDGNGTYCTQAVLAYAQSQNCIAPNAPSNSALLSCTDGQWAVAENCINGCQSGEIASNDECSLATCDCFVRVAWCGASAGRHGMSELGCQVPLIPEHDNDILGCENGQWIVKQACENGCVEEATGTPDYCRPNQANQVENWPACADHPNLLKAGLDPEASDRLRCVGITNDQISQTIGNAVASAGYHAADGNVDGHPYCAAVDIRTRGMNENEILNLLDRLGRNGFAAWYRKPGSDGWPANQSPHIHAVFAGVRMKAQLREQVRDFLVGKNGLSSHRAYQFWDIPNEVQDLIRNLFLRHYTP
jgi:hypothetical protein